MSASWLPLFFFLVVARKKGGGVADASRRDPHLLLGEAQVAVAERLGDPGERLGGVPATRQGREEKRAKDDTKGARGCVLYNYDLTAYLLASWLRLVLNMRELSPRVRRLIEACIATSTVLVPTNYYTSHTE